jgi:hypothetical protein
MSVDRRHISSEEYGSLSDQKAGDWRLISDVNPALFGVAGALFAAGVAQHQAFIVALSPLPLFLGVWHMVRHARLQLQMITYLATHSPPGQASWEVDIATVRPRFWKAEESRGLPGRLSRKSERAAKWLARLMRPSAWNTWLVISAVVAVAADLVPLLAGYDDAGWALLVGAGTLALAVGVIERQAARIDGDRNTWTELWRDYQSEESERQ